MTATINTVSWNNTNQTVIIDGSGFGTQNVYNGDNPFLKLYDHNEGPTNTGWGAGWSNPGEHDAVTLKVTSWTNTEIIISGFTGQYGNNNWIFKPGDLVEVLLSDANGPAPQNHFDV